MNRKNWTSALVALMMVISMMTCFAVPTAVAETEMALPEDAVSVQEVETSESTNFYIETIEDLIYAATNWKKYVAGDTIFLINDLDIDTYDGDFTGEFTGFGIRQDPSDQMRADFNGLGHTIYNYSHTVALFGGMSGDVTNLTFVNATVNSSGYEGILFGFTGVGANANLTVKNVHFVNCTLTNTNGYVGLMFGYLHGKTRSITIEDCSAINSSVTDEGQSAGLFWGRIGDSGSLTVKNVFAYNCSVTDKGAAKKGGGLLGGDFYPKVAGDILVTIDNVAIIDCVRESQLSDPSILYGFQTSGTAKVMATISNVYTCGVTSNGESVEILVNQEDADSTASFTNVVTNASVLASVNNTVDNENIADPFDIHLAAAWMNKNALFRWAVKEGEFLPADENNPEAYLVTFETEEGDVYFGTDVTGAIHPTEDELNLLGGKSWLDAQTGESWTLNWDQTYTGYYRYVEEGLHRYRYLPEGNDRHRLICLGEENCTQHREKVRSCMDDGCMLRNDALDAAEVKYTSPALLGYTCTLCGNAFTTPDPDQPMASPVIMTTDAEDYATEDIATVTVAAAEDSGIASFVAAIEYDPEFLTYSEDEDFSEDECGGWIDLVDVTEPKTLKFKVGNKMSDIKLTLVYAEDAAGNALSFHELACETTVTIKNSIVSVYEVENSDSTKFSIFTIEELIFAAQKYSKFTAGDTIYLYTDLHIDEYGGDFAAEFPGFGASSDTAMFSANFDGRGNTIYGYNDTHAMFNKVNAITISNLKFADAEMGATGANLASGASLLLGQNSLPKVSGQTLTVTVDNVHIQNSTMWASANAGLMMGFQNGRYAHVVFKNCSIIGSVVCADAEAEGNGIFVSGYKGGYNKNCGIEFHNVVVVGNKMLGGVKSYGAGIMVGYWNQQTTKYPAVFENVLVMNNTVECGDNLQVNVLGHRRAGSRDYTIKNIISVNNLVGADADNDSTLKAINRLYTDYGTTLNDDWSVISDVNLMLSDTSSSAKSKTAKATTDMINVQGAVALLNEKTAVLWTVDENEDVVPAGIGKTPKAITFKDDDYTTVLAILGTNPATGTLVADEDALALLETKAWYDNGGNLAIRKGEDAAVWDTVAPEKNCDYIAVAEDDIHLLSYYITQNNGKHIVTCADASCNKERRVVDCTRVHDHDDADLPGTYYILPMEGKTCLDCKGIWVVDGKGIVPVKLVPDNDEYPVPNDVESNEAKVDVVLPEDVYADEVTVEVTYDTAELVYTGSIATGFNCTVDDSVAGLLVVSATGVNGESGVLTTLLFETVATVTVDSGLDFELTQWVAAINKGDAFTDLMDEVTGKEDSVYFQIYFVRPYTVGDVYGNDNKVNLKDAVVLLQVLSGQRAKDDESFNLIAANVIDPAGWDGEGANTVDTADLQLILQVVTGQVEQRKLREVHDFGDELPTVIDVAIVIPK